jgi:hypothetical protein
MNPSTLMPRNTEPVKGASMPAGCPTAPTSGRTSDPYLPELSALWCGMDVVLPAL